MSSDTFDIEVLSLEGDTVELMCVTGTAGGVNDYAISRSFALMALADGMPHRGGTPLQRGISAAGGRVWEEAFHREHVGEFITRTEILRRIGIVTEERTWQNGRMEAEDIGDDPDERYPLHRFVLRVQVTDPKYLQGISAGARWGTTAYDAWWADPLRPNAERMAVVDREATYWSRDQAKQAATRAKAKPAAKKTAAKKTAKAPTTKKAAAKKAAAKRPR